MFIIESLSLYNINIYNQQSNADNYTITSWLQNNGVMPENFVAQWEYYNLSPW